MWSWQRPHFVPAPQVVAISSTDSAPASISPQIVALLTARHKHTYTVAPPFLTAPHHGVDPRPVAGGWALSQ
jgi:hypothetical protein